MHFVVNKISWFARSCPTGAEMRAYWLRWIVIMVMIMPVSMSFVEYGAGVGIERAGGGPEHGRVPGRLSRSVMDMLEALLAARIRVSVAGTGLVAITFRILDK